MQIKALQYVFIHSIRKPAAMRLLLLLSASVALTALLLGNPNPAAAAGRTILVLGDSISAAYGLDESDGWVSLMEAELQKTDPEIQVVNASISGDTTDGGVQRLPDALARFTPEIVIIELGGNDGLRGQSLKLMKRNLLTMIEMTRISGAEPLILGMRIPTNYGEYFTERFFKVFQQAAYESETAIVPFLLAPIATEREYFQEDGVHPTAEAQPLLMELVLPNVVALLESMAVSQ